MTYSDGGAFAIGEHVGSDQVRHFAKRPAQGGRCAHSRPRALRGGHCAAGRAHRRGGALSSRPCALPDHQCGARAGDARRPSRPDGKRRQRPRQSALCRAPARPLGGCAALSDPRRRGGSPRWRRRCFHRGRYRRAGARRSRSDRDRLATAAARRVGSGRAQAGRAAGVAGAQEQHRVHADDRRRESDCARLCGGGEGGVARRGQPASRHQFSRYPRRDRRVRRGERPHHPDARQPGLASAARHPEPGGAENSARKIAGHYARRRRGLRHQAVSLSRIRARRRRGQAPEATGEVGCRPHRAFPERHPGARQLHDRPSCARCRQPLHRVVDRFDL